MNPWNTCDCGGAWLIRLRCLLRERSMFSFSDAKFFFSKQTVKNELTLDDMSIMYTRQDLYSNTVRIRLVRDLSMLLEFSTLHDFD